MKASFHVRLALVGFIMIPGVAFAESFQTTKIKQCSTEWKAAKARMTDGDGEAIAAGWPKFWSACAKAHKDDTFLSRKAAKAAQ